MSITDVRRFLVSGAAKLAVAYRLLRPVGSRGFARQLAIVRFALALALLLQLIPFALVDVQTSASVVPEAMPSSTGGQEFHPLHGWSLLPLGPGIAYADATAGITLTKSAPATVYSNDPVFSYTVDVDNPSGYDISGLSTISDTTLAGQTLVGGTAVYPWWYHNVSGEPTYDIQAGDSDSRTSFEAGGAAIGLSLPIADRTILTHTVLCFNGTVDGGPESFCEIVPAAYTEVRAPAFGFTQVPTEVCAGDDIEYLLTVDNPGGAPTTQVFTMTADLDPDVTYVPGSASDGGTYSAGRVTWEVDTILQEDSANYITRTYAVQVPLNITSGSYITHTYTITSLEVTPDGGGDWGTLVYNVSADFDQSGPSCVGSTVYFTNSAGTTTPTARTWTFGDGTPPVTGNLAEVSHVYSAPGFYAVSLVVTGTCGSSVQTDSYGALVEINDFDVTFTSDAPVCLGETVTFTDTTMYTGTVSSYLWDFGDGTSSALQDPTHVYTAAGSYTVVFTATTEAGCVGSYTDQIDVGAVTAGFTPSTDLLCAGSAVDFDNTTIYTDTAVGYLWNFGDGDTTILASPTHIYDNPGTYTVVMTATTAEGCVDTASAVINVDSLNASFDLGRSPACVLETVYFTDTSTISSTEPITYYWSFGDGAHSTLADPTHVYTHSGTYQVTLAISSTGGCLETASRPVVIQDVHAYFTATPNPACVLADVSFSNLSVVSATGGVTYEWDLGDGTHLTALNPTHPYSAAGEYTVVLTATTDAGCVDTYSAVVSIEQAAADFDAVPSPVCLGETTHFTDTSVVTGTVVSYLWNFGDGNSASGPTATHTYLLAGNYTVQLQVTTEGGCVSTHQESVFVEEVAADFTMDPNPVCVYEDVSFTNDSAIIAAEGVTYLWNFGDGATSTITNPVHAYTSAGDYTVALTVTTIGGGCADTWSDVVHVQDVRAEFTMAPEPACVLETIHFTNTSVITGATAGYHWDFGDGSTSSAVNPTYYYGASGTYEVALTITTVGGCADTYTDTVHIEDVTASFEVDPSPACAGETVYFTDTSTLDTVDGATYFWEFGDGGTSTLQNPTHVYATPNSYIVHLTVTTAEAGCVDTAQQTLYIEAVEAAFTPSTTLLCTGGTVNFTNHTSYTGVGISYLWDFGDGVTSILPNPSHTFNTPGNHTVVLTATTNSGCFDTASTVIHVEYLDASFTVDSTPACVGETVAFSDTSTITASSTVSYAWTFGDGATSTAHNPTHTYAAAGNYAVNLTLTSGGGCVDVATMLVNVQDVHADFRVSPNPACVLDLVGFNNRTAITGTAVVSYLWDFGDGITSTVTSPSHQYTRSGDFTVLLTAVTAAGCESTHSVVVSIEDVVADFDVDPNPACVDETVYFTDTSAVTGTITSYAWTFGDGGTSAEANPTHTYLLPGNYTVQLDVETESGCTSSHSTVVQVELISANFAVSANPVCVGQNINFTNASYYVAPSGASYLWNFGDGSTSTATSPSHSYGAAGDYTVVLTATTVGGGCISTHSTVVHVQDAQASFTMARDPACVGETVRFTNTTVVSGTGATYQWNFGDGSTSTATNPTYAYSDPGTYTVVLTARTTGAGCVDIYTDTIVIEEVVAGFTPSDSPACVLNPIDFTNTSVVSAASVGYQWTFGDGATSTDEEPTHTYTQPGEYTVALTVTSGGAGCVDTYSEGIVIEDIVASFTSSPNIICAAGSVHFTNTTVFTGTGVSYLWNFGDGTTSILASPSHPYTHPGTYTATLTASTPGGCVDTASTTIQVDFLDLTSITVSDNPACIGDPLTFSVNGTISATTLSYWWSFSDGYYSTSPSPVHAFGVAGTYSVTVYVETGVGCEDTVGMQVTIEGVEASFVAGPNPVCLGAPVGFVNTTVLTDPVSVDYLWEFGDGGTSTATNTNHTYAATGTYVARLTATTSAGCTDSYTRSIVVQDVTADFTAVPNPVCMAENVQFTNTSVVEAASATYLWTFGDGVTSTVQSPVHAYGQAGNYTARLTVTVPAGCVDTHSEVIQVEDVSAAFNLAPSPVCVGTPVVFTDTSLYVAPSGVTYAWSFGDGGTSTVRNPTHPYTSSGQYTVTLTVTTVGAGCSDVYTRLVRVEDVVASYTAGPNPACAAETVYFTNTSTITAFGSVSYLWQFSDGWTSTEASPHHAFSLAGTYPVTLTVSTAGGCSDSYTDAIEVEDVTASFTTSGNPVCVGEPVLFTDTSVVEPSAGAIYLWDFGDGATSADRNVTHAYATTGDFLVRLTVTTAGAGCVDSHTTLMSVEDVDTSFLASTDELCAGSTAYFTNTSQITATGVSYLWSFGDGGTSHNANVASHAYAVAGDYTVSLSITTSAGCVGVYTRPMHVEGLSAAFTMTPSPACADAPVEFTSTSVVTATSANYLWTFGDGTTSTLSRTVHTYANPGVYVVALTVDTGAGCSDTVAKTLTVQNVRASFSALPDPVCALEQMTFVSTSVYSGTIAAYSWNFGDGSTGTGIVTNHTYASPGTYQATLTLTNTAGCSDSTARTVVVGGAVASYTAAPNPVCFADTVHFTSTSAVSGTASYLWQFGDGATATGTQAAHIYGATGAYSVTLTVTSSMGCADQVAHTVQVAPLPAPAFSSNSPVCALTPMSFTNLTPGSLSGVRWNFGDGSLSTQTSPTHVYASGGTHTVTLTVTNTSGCVASIQHQVVASEAPVPAFTHSTPTCVGNPVTFTNQTTAGYAALLWSFGDGTTSTTVSPVHTFGSADRFTVTLTVTNTGGCSASLSQVVIAGSLPSASFTSDAPHCLGELTVFTNTTAGNNFYNWTFGDGTGSLDTSPTHMYAAAGNYTVVMTATDMGGCGQDVASTTVSIGAVPAPQAVYTPTYVHVGDVVEFTDEGTGATSWLWNFGDGSAVAAGETVTHVYESAHVYNVVLTTTNGSCEAVDQVSVNVHPAVGEQYVYLPTIEKNGGAENNPDLIVSSSISVEPVSPYMLEYATVQVTIRNQGPVAAPQFDVSLFIDRTPGVNKDYEERYEDVQRVSSLGAGASKTLSWINYFNSAGNHTLYVYVDSRGPSDEYGKVWEYNETNNVSDPLVVVVRSWYSGSSSDAGSGEGWGDVQSTQPEKVSAPD